MALLLVSCILVLAVSADVAVYRPSKEPGPLICPPDQDIFTKYWFTLPIECEDQIPDVNYINPPCFYYLAAQRNPFNSSFVDFYLSAPVQGYVAVGFSKDSVMGEDDVIGCKRDPQTGAISVVNAWNPAPQHAANVRDPSQHGVCQYSHGTIYRNGRLGCKFSRYIAPVNPDYDYDLNNSYFLFLARSDNGSSPHFLKHDETPLISYFPVNVLRDNTTSGGYIPRGGLIKAHGVLMMFAWLFIYVLIFLLGAGILRKQNLFDISRENWWFKTFRALSIMTIVVMVIGIILVIIANRNNGSYGFLPSSPCGFAFSHAVMGYITPLSVVAYLVPFHCFISSTRSKSFVHTMAVLFGLCFFLAISLVIMSGIFGLNLFQSGCALVDNLSLFLVLFFPGILKCVVKCAKIFLVIAGCCRVKEHGMCSCCYRACPWSLNKLICFVYVLYLFLFVVTTIVMLFVMVFIIISPTLGYVSL